MGLPPHLGGHGSRAIGNIDPARANSEARDHRSFSPGMSSRVKPCGKSRTASRLRGLTPAANPVFWLPYLRRPSLPLKSRTPATRFKTSHAAGHRMCLAWSLSNSRLRASFPALLAAAMV